MPTPKYFVTGFRALKPAHVMTQPQTFAWLGEAHTQAEKTHATHNGAQFEEGPFRGRIALALKRFGCSADKIATRGFELGDGNHMRWPDMRIYGLNAQPEGAGMLSRTQLFGEVAASAFERFYARENQQPSDLLHVTCTGYTSPSAAQLLVSKEAGGSTLE